MPLLPHTATVSNPLDYTTPIWGMPEKTEPVFDTMVKSDTDMAVLIQDYPAAGWMKAAYITIMMRWHLSARPSANIPAAVCCTISENLDQNIRDELIQAGVAPMQGIGDCMKAMKASAQYARTRQELLASPPAELMTLSDHLSADTVMLDEKKSKSLLAKAGLRIPRSVLITDPDQISDKTFPEDMIFPLVAKAVSPTCLTKQNMVPLN